MARCASPQVCVHRHRHCHLHERKVEIIREWQHNHHAWFHYDGHRRLQDAHRKTAIRAASLNDSIDFYGLFEKVKVRDVMHPRRGIMCFRYDRLLGGQLDTGA